MGEAGKIESWQAEAYSLLLALHRYAKWLSSLRSAKPSSVSAADREIRLILILRDEHFPTLSRQVGELAYGHRQVKEALAGRGTFGNSQAPADGDHLGRGARQAEVVNRVVSMVEKYLNPAPSLQQDGMAARREVAALVCESPAPKV